MRLSTTQRGVNNTGCVNARGGGSGTKAFKCIGVVNNTHVSTTWGVYRVTI